MEHKAWKWFFIRRFLLILALVSLSEWLLNLFYHNCLYPWLEEVFHIRFFMAGWEDGQSISLLFKGVLYLAARGISSQFPGVSGDWLQWAAEQAAGNKLMGELLGQTAHMSQREARFYLAGTAVLAGFIILTMLLPYLAAALVFSHMVEVHIRELEEQDQKQREEYSKRRNLLLSDVAHDLKTPMTTVAGYAKALLEEGDAPREEYLTAVYRKSMQMSGLLNLLFEYVKLDSEGYRLQKTRENIWELLRESIAGLYMDFEEKEMDILPEIPEGECFLQVDRLQFSRVIANLLNNAIRHNPNGTRVSVEAEAGDGAAVIRVRDNGAKIPEGTARYIFDPFVSGDESRRSKGGSGLGLSIAHKVIAMHGGSLSLEQEPEGPWTKSFVIRLDIGECEKGVY